MKSLGIKLIALAGLLVPSTMLAAGIQVSPDVLSFTITIGTVASDNITVVNPTADVQVFQVYPDDFSSTIKAEPESFTLESGAKKSVKITIDSRGAGTQVAATNLSVVGKPLADNKFSVGTGVKIPLSIAITAASPSSDSLNQKQLIIFGAAAILIGGIVIGNKFRRKDKPKPNLPIS